MTIGTVTCANKANLSLMRTAFAGNTQQSFATFNVIQSFVNDNDFVADSVELHINGNRNFIVYGVKVLINGEFVEFDIRETPEAELQFNEGMQNGSFSSIAIKDESSDAIHLTIGNIPAKTAFEVHFCCSLTAEMPLDNKITFRIPCVSGFENVPVHMDMNVSQINAIKEVSVGQEGFAYTPESETQGKLVFNADRLNSPEIAISIELNENLESTAIVSKIGEEEYVGIAAIAGIPSKKDLKSDIWLVIDCSGSMSGSSIRTAKETLLFFLKSLPRQGFFNVVRFGSSFEAMFPESVVFDEENYHAAITGVDAMRADLGGTDLYSPLSYIFGKPTIKGYARQVFVLTDGQVEAEAEIISLATSNRTNHRVFSVGIGNGVERSFIEDLATCSGGKASFVAASGDAALVATMTQLQSALRPALVENQMHISGIESFEVAPYPVPSLFHRVLTHIYVRCSGATGDDAGVLISGRTGEKDIDIGMEITRVESKVHFDKFFGYFNIRDIEEKIAIAATEEATELKQRAVRLSMQTGIVSQFTAMCNVIPLAKQDVRASEQKPQMPSSRNAMQMQRQRQQQQAPMAQQQPQMSKRQVRQNVAWNNRQMGQQQQASAVQGWGCNQSGFGPSNAQWSQPCSPPPPPSGGLPPAMPGGLGCLPQQVPQASNLISYSAASGPMAFQQAPMSSMAFGSGEVGHRQSRSSTARSMFGALSAQSCAPPPPPPPSACYAPPPPPSACYAPPSACYAPPQVEAFGLSMPPPPPFVPCPTQMKQEASGTSVTQCDVQSIVMGQEFGGFWNKGGLINPAKIGWDKVCDLSVFADVTLRERVQSTIIALALLEKHGSDKRVVWAMVNDRALEWLQEQSTAIDWITAINKVKELIE